MSALSLKQRNLTDQLTKTLMKDLSKAQIADVLTDMKRNLFLIDKKYICAVLFPEITNPSRIPAKYSHETTLFTDVFHLYLTVYPNDPYLLENGSEAPNETVWAGDQKVSPATDSSVINLVGHDGNNVAVLGSEVIREVTPQEPNVKGASGCIIFLPKITNMPCLWQAQSFAFSEKSDLVTSGLLQGTSKIVNSDETWYQGQKYAGDRGKLAWRLLPQSNSSQIANNYAQVRMIGASLRMQFMAAADSEQGQMTGQHIWETKPCRLTENIIEQTEGAISVRPSQGLRMTWTPKDETDFQMYGTDYGFVPGTRRTLVDGVDVTNVKSVWEAEDLTLMEQIITAEDYYGTGSAKFSLQPARLENARISQQITNEQAFTSQPPADIIGMGQRAGDTHQNPEMFAICYRGVQPGKEVFRIDIVRHFEGIPREEIKDIVSVNRAVYNQASLDLIVNQKLTQDTNVDVLPSHDELKMRKNRKLDQFENIAQQDPRYINDYGQYQQDRYGVRASSHKYAQGLDTASAAMKF